MSARSRVMCPARSSVVSPTDQGGDHLERDDLGDVGEHVDLGVPRDGGQDLIDDLVVVGSVTHHQVARVIQRVIGIPGVVRTRSQMALTQRIPLRTLPLIHQNQWPERRQ
jgi:hypothetical protein